MQTLRLALTLYQPTYREVLICIYNLTDDETFNLWDLILVTFTGYSNLLIISDRLCFIGFNILYISAIGISVKTHIGASLVTTIPRLNRLPPVWGFPCSLRKLLET